MAYTEIEQDEPESPRIEPSPAEYTYWGFCAGYAGRQPAALETEQAQAFYDRGYVRGVVAAAQERQAAQDPGKPARRAVIGAQARKQPSARRIRMSASACSAAPGRRIFTTTSRPSGSPARWICATDAAASGAISKVANTCVHGRPNAASTSRTAYSAGNGSACVCRRASARSASSGNRSARRLRC